MKNLRVLLTTIATGFAIGLGHFVLAQETTPISVTVEPIQYAAVKGNAGNFRALNWMKDGANGGVTNLTFIDQINKDTSVEFEGGLFPKTEDYDDHLILRKGDLAFLKIDYKSFRKYFDNTGGVYQDKVSGIAFPGTQSGVKLNSPDLQLDLSYFKLEAGLGDVNDPDLDIIYQHDAKNGAKSLLQWTPAYNSANSAYRAIGPSYQDINDAADTVTLQEKKNIAGVTIKGEQRAEVDYNNNLTVMPYINNPGSAASTYNQLRTANEYLDAKLFSSGVRLEKWMFNDNTFAGLGYHYNHTRDTDLMQNQVLNSVTGVVTDYSGARQSLWSYSSAHEDDHVWTGNINTNLTQDLSFVSDVRYEHMGNEGDSKYLEDTATVGVLSSTDTESMQNHQDREGEHVALRYSGIPHTSLYAESDLEQQRNWVNESYFSTGSPSSNLTLERLNRVQKESWTLGGRIVPDKYFAITTQIRQRWEDNNYDTISAFNPGNQTFLDALNINGIEATSTVAWKPYRWLQNSFKYQFVNTVYYPRQASEGTGVANYNISENHMLSSIFTYDISLQPIDPILLMFSYSHNQNYVRTVNASTATATIPTFNSGDNMWLFSSSYTPREDLTWTNTVTYTLSPNYVDFSTGVPYGSSFKQLSFETGLQWTLHKWITITPNYKYASYRGNSLVDNGNYSANIFQLDLKFKW